MIRRIVSIGALTGATLLSASAQAQFYWGPFGARPPIVDDYYYRRPPGRIPAPVEDVEDAFNAGEVIGILRDSGYRTLTRPRRTGGVFVANAVDRNGNRVRVVVGAYDGDIRGVTALAPEKPREPRVARTPNPPAVTMPDSSATVTPDANANPLNGAIGAGSGGGAAGSAGAPPAVANTPRGDSPRSTQPRLQPSTQVARPAPADTRPATRVILPNPADNNAAPPPQAAPTQPAAPPLLAPSQALSPPPAPPVSAPPPQIAAPAVPPVAAPVIVPASPPIATPAVPSVPPPVAALDDVRKTPATETLPVPPVTMD